MPYSGVIGINVLFMRITIGSILLAVLFFLAGNDCLAQAGATTMYGKVTLPDSMPANGAKVIAKHIPTGSLFAAITDTTGAYVIPGISIGGPYILEVTLDGYETYSRKDIYLTLAVFKQDISLAVKEGKGAKTANLHQDDTYRSLAGNRRHKARIAVR
jgi:hypothetical protein